MCHNWSQERRKRSFPNGSKAKIVIRILTICVRWDQYGSVHYELLKVGQTIASDLCCYCLNKIEAKRTTINQQYFIITIPNLTHLSSFMTQQVLKVLD